MEPNRLEEIMRLNDRVAKSGGLCEVYARVAVFGQTAIIQWHNGLGLAWFIVAQALILGGYLLAARLYYREGQVRPTNSFLLTAISVCFGVTVGVLAVTAEKIGFLFLTWLPTLTSAYMIAIGAVAGIGRYWLIGAGMLVVSVMVPLGFLPPEMVTFGGIVGLGWTTSGVIALIQRKRALAQLKDVVGRG